MEEKIEEKKEETSQSAVANAATKDNEQKNPTSAEEELLKYQKERDEYLDGWKRAKAELLNYKKEEAQRFEAVLKFANEELIKNLIRVLDSFELGLAALEKEGAGQKGLYLIYGQLKDALKAYGLEEAPSAVGKKFEPAKQEAIAEVESTQPTGIIIEEVEKGYLLNGRVIRPSRVKVAK